MKLSEPTVEAELAYLRAWVQADSDFAPCRFVEDAVRERIQELEVRLAGEEES